MNKAERKSKIFWYASEFYTVKQVVGFETPEPNVWWCPSTGYSLTEGYQLYRTKYGAIQRAIEMIGEKQKFLEAALIELKKQKAFIDT